MLIVNTLFLDTFSFLYKLIHTHFISYVIILVLCLALLRWTWKNLKSQLKTKKSNLVTKFFLLCLTIYVTSFTVWFIFIHFHTFRLVTN